MTEPPPPPSVPPADPARSAEPAEARPGAGTGAGRPRPSWFRQVTFHSLLAGLCPIVPIPFLDDRILKAVRRKMVRELAAERGIELDADRIDLLAGIVGTRRGCVGWVLWAAFSLTVRLLGKLFRKILILFAVKESVDTASRAFHEGYLLHLAFAWAVDWDEGWRHDRDHREDGEGSARPPGSHPGPVQGLDRDRAWGLRQIIEATVDEVDPRPLEQALRRAFRGSRGLLRRAARLLVRKQGVSDPGFGSASGSAAGSDPLPEAEERRLLGGLLDRLTAELWEQRGYLEALEGRFRERLETAGARPGGEGLARGGGPSGGRVEGAGPTG